MSFLETENMSPGLRERSAQVTFLIILHAFYPDQYGSCALVLNILFTKSSQTTIPMVGQFCLQAAFEFKGIMSRKGDCWDNVVVESLFGSLKQERV